MAKYSDIQMSLDCPGCGRPIDGWEATCGLVKAACGCVWELADGGELRKIDTPEEAARIKHATCLEWEAAEAKKNAQAAEALAQLAKEGQRFGFVLRDANPNFFSCGHYPEWRVAAARTSEEAEFASLDEARAVAQRRNTASDKAWQGYLGG